MLISHYFRATFKQISKDLVSVEWSNKNDLLWVPLKDSPQLHKSPVDSTNI